MILESHRQLEAVHIEVEIILKHPMVIGIYEARASQFQTAQTAANPFQVGFKSASGGKSSRRISRRRLVSLN
jgi:hypothetical protein